MNNFLQTGQKSGGGTGSSNQTADGNQEPNDCDMEMDGEQRTDADESSALAETKMITSNQPEVAIDIDNVLKVIETAENSAETQAGSAINVNAQNVESDTEADSCNRKKSNNESHKRGAVAGPDPTKPLQPRAKLLRQQRKAEKLAAKVNSTNAVSDDTSKADATNKPPKNTEKTLKSFINEMPADGKHKLKVCQNEVSFCSIQFRMNFSFSSNLMMFCDLFFISG